MKSSHRTAGKTTGDDTELSEACPFPILKCNQDGAVLFMNGACKHLLDQMGVASDQFSLIVPERFVGILQRVLQDRQKMDLNTKYRDRALHLTFVPSRNRAHVFIFINDLTAQNEAEAQLIQSDKMASLDLLVAGLAHEINNPLGALHSNSDILSRAIGKLGKLIDAGHNPADPARYREMKRLLEILQDVYLNNTTASDRMINIVQNLKNFVRLDEAERKKVNIHEGLESTLTLVQHLLRNRIHVIRQYGDLPDIECFPNQLNQVFMNIFINSAQAIPDRGTITIKTGTEDGSITIAIRDTGVGIPAENLSKVFDPGFTTKGIGVGTGLGLSICYKIVQNHHGKIEIQSEVGEGSTFTIKLPVISLEGDHAN